jgi:intein-encoded DNA endonuclease-like protein
MSNELDVIRQAEKESQVISLYASTYDTAHIIKETGLKKSQIEEILRSYRQYAMQDKVLREMSRETVIKTKLHYDQLIQKMYDAVAVANDNGDYKSEMQGVKAIADIEKQRVDFMQKAGMLADNEIGDQIVESERKQRIIIDILKDISKQYPKIGLEIQERLKEVTGVLEGVPSERTNI